MFTVRNASYHLLVDSFGIVITSNENNIACVSTVYAFFLQLWYY